ncbi:UDP-N-acetylmuramate dehydrogenase [Pseudodesulfovibrio indicus]|uniref:UDP-N-acetylenolpyruvoylglucosamine reductase n=1 Tax=Pseudodesulfovibrio indicus TaxID=1716143 RepID=A0A126QLJ2_9BACT|nr:UDP-N-acetylmuramate dehydrogenase [Pseudodesulfovibrio indicus]AMK10669.1 UDP-N-acetylenolpyruvoylglucosamine reductase [Pseudodesulfovibrio indicus]TDT91643.1 UDP-N-acetylmuramate dehydrogenase [Pseudodesulfovibrio indicus]
MALELTANPSLSERTTLRVGGTAVVEAVVREEKDLDELSEFLLRETVRPFVLGAGSNLLVTDEPLDLALIRVDGSFGPERVERDGSTLIVRCGAGLRLPGLLGWAQKAGFSGLEGMTGIPGTVGGAVAMNAGSYGVEIGDLVTRVRIWSPAQGLVWLDSNQCIFSYRHFSLAKPAGKCLVWEVELALRESDPKAVRSAMRDVYGKKKETQPVTARTAGCVFKNPADQSAGKLLDQVGMKGARRGGMAFSELHANFLVNLGGGTCADALELMNMGREEVKERFGVNLEPEVIIL